MLKSSDPNIRRYLVTESHTGGLSRRLHKTEIPPDNNLKIHKQTINVIILDWRNIVVVLVYGVEVENSRALSYTHATNECNDTCEDEMFFGTHEIFILTQCSGLRLPPPLLQPCSCTDLHTVVCRHV